MQWRGHGVIAPFFKYRRWRGGGEDGHAQTHAPVKRLVSLVTRKATALAPFCPSSTLRLSGVNPPASLNQEKVIGSNPQPQDHGAALSTPLVPLLCCPVPR